MITTTILLFLLSAAAAARRPRVVGWYDGVHPPVDQIPWDIYTHVRYGGPMINDSGQCFCNLTQMAPLVAAAHAHNASVLWAPGIEFGDFRANLPLHEMPPAELDERFNEEDFHANYWASIGRAQADCGVDGIEVDYEHGPNKWGVVTPAKADAYTQWLAKLRQVTGKPVSADISVWGVAPGNYVLGVLPWVNVTKLNEGAFDYVNTMSYHWNRDGDIWSWKKDLYFLLSVWKIDPSRVSLGVPYYSHPSSRTWGGLSTKCPNITADQNVCDGEVFVGEDMQFKIGRLAASHDVGGLFPWAMSYDAFGDNKTLARSLAAGYIS